MSGPPPSRMVHAVLRCYPRRWRRRHGEEAAELAVLLMRDGIPERLIAWSYMAGAIRARLTPQPGHRLAAAAAAVLVGAAALMAPLGLLSASALASSAGSARPGAPVRSASSDGSARSTSPGGPVRSAGSGRAVGAPSSGRGLAGQADPAARLAAQLRCGTLHGQTVRAAGPALERWHATILWAVPGRAASHVAPPGTYYLAGGQRLAPDVIVIRVTRLRPAGQATVGGHERC
jgi:hypothetical protein